MPRLPSHVIAVAASAGGVEALRAVVAALPEDLDAAVCIVLHIPPTGRSLLAPILARETSLPTKLAEHGAPLRPGTIYVARADQHLLIRETEIELSYGPKENAVRPAADPMFRSLARAWDRRGIAVVLSGALDDGAAGAVAVAEAGGRVVVQDPEDALVPGMPSSALAAVPTAQVVPLDAMGATLARLVQTGQSDASKEVTVSPDPDPVEMEGVATRPEGPATGFTCPECSGAIWEVREGELVRYRCRVGHAYSEEAMVQEQGSAVEAALWTALEVLEERSELLRRIADRMEHRQTRTERRFRLQARLADQRAAVLRRALTLDAADAEATG
ncbi:MAG TPA: chemotaxis protein CheB [Solirubrobacter sp.]|nr:chemotaxis protein CheB [Solirubrobacter sp.]